MNYQQVLALIQQFIVANGNNEITANVLRPILEAILAQPNELIGDLDDLQTTDQSSLVAAINEALSLITPTIGSYNTKIHYLSLNGIDTNLPELTKIAEAVKIHGPFTCDAGQQMVFRTVLTVGNQVNGMVVSRYYRLLRNMTTIGGPSSYVDISPTWLMPDGVSEYSNPETNGSIVELGDIGTDNVWDAFNLGNNGAAWDMNEYRFVRATQNSEIMFWAFTGQERFYGGPDMNVEPDIFEAFENDFFLITDQPPAPDPGDGTIETEDTVDISLTGDGTDANKLKATLQPTPNPTDIFGRTDDHWQPVVRRMEEDGQMWVEVLSPIGEILLQYSEQYFDEDTQDTAGRNTLLNTRFGVKTLKGQIDVNAIGFSAALDAQGDHINAIGYTAALDSQGNNINAIGNQAARDSLGQYINAIGLEAGSNSEGGYINAIGRQAGRQAKGDHINALGHQASLNAEGSYINAFGVTAGRYSKGDDVNVFGRNSYNLSANPKYDRVNIFGPEIQPTKSDQNIISGHEFIMPLSTPATVMAGGPKSLTTLETVEEMIENTPQGFTTQIIDTGGNYNNLEVTADLLVFTNENAQAILNGIWGRKEFHILNLSSQYEILINHDSSSVSGNGQPIMLPTNSGTAGIKGTARVLQTDSYGYFVADTWGSKYRPEFSELTEDKVMLVGADHRAKAEDIIELKFYRTNQSTAMDSAELENEYPNSIQGTEVICTPINKKYEKINNLGDWIEIDFATI